MKVLCLIPITSRGRTKLNQRKPFIQFFKSHCSVLFFFFLDSMWINIYPFNSLSLFQRPRIRKRHKATDRRPLLPPLRILWHSRSAPKQQPESNSLLASLSAIYGTCHITTVSRKQTQMPARIFPWSSAMVCFIGQHPDLNLSLKNLDSWHLKSIQEEVAVFLYSIESASLEVPWCINNSICYKRG